MRNQSNRNSTTGADPTRPQPVPIRHLPPPVQRWTLDVERSEFIQVHTVAITRRSRVILRRFNILTVLTLLTLVVSGCQSLTYTGPSGEHFTRRSFASQTAISSLTVEAATNGLRRVELRGYTNDQTQALGAVTEAAVRAAIQGAKP